MFLKISEIEHINESGISEYTSNSVFMKYVQLMYGIMFTHESMK